MNEGTPEGAVRSCSYQPHPSPRGNDIRFSLAACAPGTQVQGTDRPWRGRFILNGLRPEQGHAGGVQATEAGKGTPGLLRPPLTGQGSHLGVLMGGLPVLLPSGWRGPSAFPKLPVSTGRDSQIRLGLPLPSPPPWTRCFLGFPAPEKVISQDLKNMALNHNLTRTQTKGAGSRQHLQNDKTQSLPAAPTAKRLCHAWSATTSTRRLR